MDRIRFHHQFSLFCHLFWLAVILSVWSVPQWFGPQAIRSVGGVVLYEYVCVFLGTALLAIAAEPRPRWQRYGLFVAVGSMFVAITVLLFLESPDRLMPFLALTLLVKNLRVLFSPGSEGADQALFRGLLTLATILLPVFLFLVVQIPAPLLGLGALEVIRDLRFGGGDPLPPQQLLAVGAVYFGLQAALAVRLDRPFQS